MTNQQLHRTQDGETEVRRLVERAKEQGGYDLPDIAKATGYSVSSLSSFLNGRYGARGTRIVAACIAWLRSIGVSIDKDAFELYLPIRSSETVRQCCTMAQEEGSMVAVIGPAGVGKTTGLESWMRMARVEDVRHVFVRCRPTTTAVALIRNIADAMDLPHKASSDLQLAAICEALRREPAVLIVDEAQHLGTRALEVVRSIHDATMSGVVFSGSMQLAKTFEEGEGHEIELGQLQDRIALREYLGALKPLETARFAEEWLGGVKLDAATKTELHAISRGIPRRLVRVLNHSQRMATASSAPIDAQLVRQAAKKLVGLGLLSDKEEV